MKSCFFLFLLLIVSFPLCAKPKVCLNMIVKDESAVIEHCLESVKPLIDYWVIVDTGSTDGTQEVIKKYMKGIPGELFERPWKNFGYNRTEALELAKDKADYLLFMDADDWLAYDKDYTLPPLVLGAYQIEFTNDGSFSYLKPHLVKADLSWQWIGVLHEYITCDTLFSSEVLEGVKYMIGGTGARSQDPEKYYKCAKILEEGLKEEPGNVRYVFYIAESYKDAGYPEKALEYYRKRAAMGGWDEEVYWSLLQAAKLESNLNYDKETVIESYYRAHRYRPYRKEPIYYLSEIYNQTGKYALAYACIKGSDYIPDPPTKDLLFHEAWTEDWGLLFQLSISAYWLGHYQESIDLCNELLLTKKLPPNYMHQVTVNRSFPYEKLHYEEFCKQKEIHAQEPKAA